MAQCVWHAHSTRHPYNACVYVRGDKGGVKGGVKGGELGDEGYEGVPNWR